VINLSEGIVYIPVRQHIELLWPHELISIPDLSLLDGIWIRPAKIIYEQDQSRLLARSGVLFDNALEFGIPGFDVVTFSLGDTTAGTEIELAAEFGDGLFKITIGPVPLTINLRTELLQRAVEVQAGGAGARKFEARPEEPLSIQVGQLSFSWTTDGSIELIAVPAFSLPFAMLADTGIVVEATELQLILNASDASSLPITPAPTESGLYLGVAKVYFPGELAGVIPDTVEVQRAFLSHGGLSATISGEWNPVWDETNSRFTESGSGDLFGLAFGLEKVQIELKQNLPVDSTIEAKLLVPYFDEPAAVSVELGLDGDFSIRLRALDADGFTIRKEELLALTLKEVAIRKETEVGTLVISGGLQPLLLAADGLEWPRLEVTGIELDTTGRILIREAWLELNSLSTIDLFGFQFELTRLGIGYEESTDSLWIDLTGSIRLMEQIPVGVGVEGFRLTWPRTLYEDLNLSNVSELSVEQMLEIASQIQVRFAGLMIYYGVPQTIEFEGLIRFFKEEQIIGFAGDIALRIPSSGFALEAGLMLGINFEEPPYPFLYLYLGVELPSGIPLGQSGLALKGALGLVGLNVEPARDAPDNWYYDWYKRDPAPGAHQTTKWRNTRMAAAAGIGVTITTTDGYIVGIRGLIVLALPGPVLVLEGRGLVFDGLLPGEPPLRVLGVLDGKSRIAQINLEAQGVVVRDVLEAYAPIEAFFDFVDPTNWHLYLGQDEPAERRVKASVLKFNSSFLFKADAFLMLDMIGAHTLRSRMGVFIGFAPPIPSLGPVQVQFKGVIEGGAEVTVLPEQFSGELLVSADIGVQAFGFGFRVTADADVLGEGADPFSVAASFHLSVDLPNPLQAIEAVPFIGELVPEQELPPLDIDLDFSWESPPTLAPESPLGEVMAIQALGQQQVQLGSSTKQLDGASQSAITSAQPVPAAYQSSAESAEVVPIDAAPLIEFNQNMNDRTGADFALHPDGQAFYHSIGRLRLEPSLESVRIYRHRRADAWVGDFDSDWTLLTSTLSAERNDTPMQMYGVWHADVDPGQVSAAVRRLRLWSSDPFTHTRGSLGPGYAGIGHQAGETLTSLFLDDHPAYWQAELESVETCVHPPIAYGAGTHAHASIANTNGVTFTLLGPAKVDDMEQCLQCFKGVVIRFDHDIESVTLELCSALPERVLKSITAKRNDIRSADVPITFTRPRGSDRKVQISGALFDELLIAVDINLAKVCWISSDEIARVQRAAEQGAANERVTGQWNTESPVLEPDCYYRIEIVAASTAELLPGDGPLGATLDRVYENALEVLTGSGSGGAAYFLHDSYFRTVGPPTQLMPYIAWTYPSADAQTIARSDDFAVRFRRSNIAAMFAGDGIGDLELSLIGADGKVVPGYDSYWDKSRSATFHSDERIWLEHIGVEPDDPDGPLPDDDVLRLERSCLFRDDVATEGQTGWTLKRYTPDGRLPNARHRLRSERPLITTDRADVVVARSARLPTTSSPQPLLVNGNTAWSDKTIEAVVRVPTTGVVGIAGRLSNSGSRYEAHIDQDFARIVQVGSIRSGGKILVLAEYKHRRKLDGGHLLRFTLEGNKLSFDIDGDNLITTKVQGRTLSKGRIGLIVSSRGARYTQICVRDLVNTDLLPGSRYEMIASGGIGGRLLNEPSAATAPHRDIVVNFEVRASATISMRGGGVVLEFSADKLSVKNADNTAIASAVSMNLSPEEFYPVRVESVGNRFRVRVNGALRLDFKLPSNIPATGAVAITNGLGNTRDFELREATLLRIPFVTSSARTLHERANILNVKTVLSRGNVAYPDIDMIAHDIANAELRRGVIALRDELIDRETLELRKQVVREAHATQDRATRQLAEEAGVDPYAEADKQAQLVQVYSGDTTKTPMVAIVLRTYEPMDYKFDQSGRTSAVLASRASATGKWNDIDVQWVWTADHTLLVGLPKVDPDNTVNTQLRLTLNYERDPGDEDELIDHRYDRPFHAKDGKTEPDSTSISWSRHAK